MSSAEPPRSSARPNPQHTGDPASVPAPEVQAAARAAELEAYWRTNKRYVAALLLVWFAVSLGGGVLLVDELNAVRLPGTGFKLGFWLAQQGSIYVFVVLIFVYVALMNRLDRRYEVDER